MPPAPGLYTRIKSWKKWLKSDFKEISFNLQQMCKVIRPFCWHQNFVLWGLSAPVPGLYTCIKSWKNCIKSVFKNIVMKLVRNEWKDKTFLLASKSFPLGVVCPCPGAVYMYKIMKKLYKSCFWNLQQMNEVTRHFCWHQNFVHWGLSAPAPGLYTCIKSWKQIIKSDFKEIFYEMFLLTSKFVPKGLSALAPMLNTCIKSWK